VLQICEEANADLDFVLMIPLQNFLQKMGKNLSQFNPVSFFNLELI